MPPPFPAPAMKAGNNHESKARERPVIVIFSVAYKAAKFWRGMCAQGVSRLLDLSWAHKPEAIGQKQGDRPGRSRIPITFPQTAADISWSGTCIRSTYNSHLNT